MAATLPGLVFRERGRENGCSCVWVVTSPSVILQLICPDRPGLVSELAGWVAANGGNIRHADHHTDAGAGLFLSRLEWEQQGFGLPRPAIAPAAWLYDQKTVRRDDLKIGPEFGTQVITQLRYRGHRISPLGMSDFSSLLTRVDRMHPPVAANHDQFVSVIDQCQTLLLFASGKKFDHCR